MRSASFRLSAILAVALVLGTAAGPLAHAAAYDQPDPPAVDARAVVVLDYAQGDVLYERNADLYIPPASLTKLMTMHVALKAVELGTIGLSDIITILPEETSPILPYGSSLMYLEPGMRVTFDDLLRGMAVVSGNDAAFAVARVLAGSSEEFARMMNDEARALGLSHTRFVEPSGLSEQNITTARDMAEFARLYLNLHPDALDSYHGRPSMEFPRPEVMPVGVPPPDQRIVLRNRNELVRRYEGCDGLKTGFIDESGYNLIATAERDGTRVIVVTLGGFGGKETRARDGAAILDWAFATWTTVRPQAPELPSLRVWRGASSHVDLELAVVPAFTVPADLAAGIDSRVDLEPDADAPVSRGDKLGTLTFTRGDQVIRRVDIVAARDVPKGNVLQRLKDAILKFFSRLFTPKN